MRSISAATRDSCVKVCPSLWYARDALKLDGSMTTRAAATANTIAAAYQKRRCFMITSNSNTMIANAINEPALAALALQYFHHAVAQAQQHAEHDRITEQAELWLAVSGAIDAPEQNHITQSIEGALGAIRIRPVKKRAEDPHRQHAKQQK